MVQLWKTSRWWYLPKLNISVLAILLLDVTNRNVHIYAPKDMYKIRSSFFSNSPKLEIIQNAFQHHWNVFLISWYVYEIEYGNDNEWTILNKWNGSVSQIKCRVNEASTKEYIMCDSIYVKFKTGRLNLWCLSQYHRLVGVILQKYEIGFWSAGSILFFSSLPRCWLHGWVTLWKFIELYT